MTKLKVWIPAGATTESKSKGKKKKKKKKAKLSSDQLFQLFKREIEGEKENDEINYTFKDLKKAGLVNGLIYEKVVKKVVKKHGENWWKNDIKDVKEMIDGVLEKKKGLRNGGSRRRTRRGSRRRTRRGSRRSRRGSRRGSRRRTRRSRRRSRRSRRSRRMVGGEAAPHLPTARAEAAPKRARGRWRWAGPRVLEDRF